VRNLTQFAAETEAKADIFTSLGIDWQMLVLQIVAFLILVAILGKFVYPWLIKSVDERQAKIEAANKAAKDAQAAAEKSEENVEKLLKKAQADAAEIIATAKLESASNLAAAEEKAKKRADQIVADAQDEIQKEVIAAKNTLHNETLELVALATEKVVGGTHSKEVDRDMIAKAVKESK
jgi:F-type H+-transporting ATPase subunit b